MISFRTHVVSLVAVLLALAAGVALGGGPLSETGRGALSSAGTAPQRDRAPAEGFGDAFAQASAGRLYSGRLDARPTAILTLPGADEAVVDELTAQVAAAGGEVTGRFALQPGLVEPGEKSLVDTLGSQLMQTTDPPVVDRAAPTYVRMGQLLARALTSTEPQGEQGGDVRASSLRESLVAAELLAGGPKGDAERAPLVLVVMGDDVDDDVLSGLLAGLASRSVGVVATGPTKDADLDGLRTSPAAEAVATVDGSETELGRVAAVLGLIRSLDETGGAFGASGSDGALPLG